MLCVSTTLVESQSFLEFEQATVDTTDYTKLIFSSGSRLKLQHIHDLHR